MSKNLRLVVSFSYSDVSHQTLILSSILSIAMLSVAYLSPVFRALTLLLERNSSSETFWNHEPCANQKSFMGRCWP